jgi:hypothetical protein
VQLAKKLEELAEACLVIEDEANHVDPGKHVFRISILCRDGASAACLALP